MVGSAMASVQILVCFLIRPVMYSHMEKEIRKTNTPVEAYKKQAGKKAE